MCRHELLLQKHLFAGQQFTVQIGFSVGASSLAMVVNDYAYLLVKRGGFESIASRDRSYREMEPFRLAIFNVRTGAQRELFPTRSRMQ
ncbi:hypothetical protein PS918_04002 [Pseudomonas fluorescens]|uniref:Uncharacterized protein n=1 Tax=Pseudomonas fluorescens TaxID=294 RepID=A0A5E7TLW0_PSEFL|nr:hypothetical protein PS918_04002 [Pseudomonas fluorescens]